MTVDSTECSALEQARLDRGTANGKHA